MIKKLDGEHWILTGTATRDAERKNVGEKQTALCKWGMAIGKRPDTTTIFCDCAAWRSLGEYAALIRKGDAVCAIGKIEEREYNGKTYKTFNCEWLNIAKTLVPPTATASRPLDELSRFPQVHEKAPPKDMFSEEDNGQELPF